MHSLARRFLKTAIAFLVVGLALGVWLLVRRELAGDAISARELSAHTHALLVGFVMMMIAGVALWLVYWGVRSFLNWYRYRHDIWVVTNQRLIDSYKAHPFSLRVATADLVNLQDMSVVKSGIVATMLNFGNVVCETAGSDRVAFTIAGVPRPEAMQLLIDRERDRERMRRE